MIGFAINNTVEKEPVQETAFNAPEKPVISLVKVRFEDDKVLDYYNDRFDLHEGDRVFVEGSMEGKIGEVVSVSRKFRINLNNYKRVIAHPTISFEGKFTRISDKMVCTGKCLPTPEMMRSWIKCGGEECEIVTGEPFEATLDDFLTGADITEEIFGRAIEYCQQGRVVYLRVENGVGTAFVRGTSWYEINFRISGDNVSDISCNCPYPYFCKHSVAVLITLRMMLATESIAKAETFTAIDRGYFWDTLAAGCEEIAV